MRAYVSRVEVQRALIVAFGVWLLAGAYLRDPLWVVVARAAGAVLWTFLLAWSLTVDRPGLGTARVAAGALLVTGCAAALGAPAAAAAGAGLCAVGLLMAAEHLLRRRMATAAARTALSSLPRLR